MVTTQVERIDPPTAEGGRVQLQPVSLRGRRFLIQFHELMREFGDEIPWLEGMDEMRFATNGEWFREELLQRLGQRDGDITPYQFVDSDKAGTFVGGVLGFKRSPEQLRDPRNAEIAECLEGKGVGYLSCLQVREVRRGQGSGTRIMRRAINAVIASQGSVWGVVSNRGLIPWYASLDANILSPLENRDNLWIVHWTAPL